MTASRSEEGFTLVEVLLVSVLMIVVLGATLTALTSFERSTSTNQRQNVAQDQVRNALDLATRDLRNLSSPTVNLPQAVDRADPQDVIFQSEGHIKPSGSLNPTNTTRVRYCLGPSQNLYRQIQTWTSAAPAALITETLCPGPGWATTKVVAENVVNGVRPLFTYNSADLTRITEVTVTAFVDVNPGNTPAESTLTSSVYLRNQNRRPSATFSLALADGNRIIMNASESTDPEEKAMTFRWFIDGLEVGGNIVRTDPVAPGTRTVAVEVSDGTLADMAPDQTICVPDPSQGVNCP